MESADIIDRKRLIIDALAILTALEFWDEVKSELESTYLNSLSNPNFRETAERYTLLGAQQVLSSLKNRAEQLSEANNNVHDS